MVSLLLALACPACKDEPPPLEITTGAGSTGAAGGAGGGPPTKDISRSDASDIEHGPQIAVRGQNVCVAWSGGKLDGSPSHIGYTFSTDGGDTWQPPTIISSPEDEYLDPDVAVDETGNFYLAWVSYSRVGKGGKILSATATEASGLTFFEPKSVTDDMVVGFYERPRVGVTKTGLAVIGFTELLPTGQHGLVFAVRAGMGWTRTSIGAVGEGHAMVPYPCAPPEGGAGVGRTYLVYRYQGRLSLIWSDDDAKTWGGNSGVTQEDEDGLVRQVHSCVADGDEVWVAYGISGNSELLQAIRIAYSSDGGQSFPQRIDAQDTGVLRFADPDLSYDPNARALDLAYYGGSGPGDTASALRRARIALPSRTDAGLPPPPDGGADAGTGVSSEIVFKPVALDTSSTSSQWLGEYMGIASSGGKVFVAFVDNSTDDRSHVAFQRVDAP